MSSKRKSHRAKKRSNKRKAAVEVVREQLEAAAPSAVEVPPVETSRAAAPPPDETPNAGVVVPEDDYSVPPAGDLDTRFFSAPVSWPGLRFGAEEDPFPLEAHDRVARSLAPQAVARRALFGRYVRGAVGVSLLLCAAAIVKTALTSDDAQPRRSAAALASPDPQALSPDPQALQASAAIVPGGATTEVPAASSEATLDAGDAAPPAKRPAAPPAKRPAVLPAERPGGARSLRVR